jgi:hypothetical protein
MAKNFKLSALAAALCADSATGLLVAFAEGGVTSARLRIYSTPRPDSPDDAATGTLLVEIDIGGQVTHAGSAGVLNLANIAAVAVTTGGTAAWFRIVTENDGIGTICDGSVGTGTYDLNIDNPVFVEGGLVDLAAGTITIPSGA